MWEVQCKGDMKSADYELSVIRKDNKHGHASWGWGDENKIILFGSGLGENNLNSNTKQQREFAIRVVNLLCDSLNEQQLIVERC